MSATTVAALPTQEAKRQISLRTIEIRWGYLFILPWIIGFLLFTAGPMLVSLYLSFTDYNITSQQGPAWIGAKNYSDILSIEFKSLNNPTQDAGQVLDRGYSELLRVGNTVVGATDVDFWISLKVTVFFGFMALPIGMFTSLCLALLLNTKVPGVRFFRTLIYSPVMVPVVVTAGLFLQLLGRDQGWLNLALRRIGIVGPDWIHSIQWILPALVVIGLWTAGGSMLIYLAGLQAIPTELYEAANIDGAGGWVRLRRITLPLLTPVLLYDLVLGLIGTFQYFSIAYVLTNGEGTPGKSAFFFNMYLYKQAFAFHEMGYASALAWLLFILVITITLIVFKTSGSWVFYAGGTKR